MLTELAEISRVFRQLTTGRFIDGSPLDRPLAVSEIRALAVGYTETMATALAGRSVQVLLDDQLLAAVAGDVVPAALRNAIRLADKNLYRALDTMATRDILEPACA